jgi:hypothetical protein
MKQVVEFNPEAPMLTFRQWYETLRTISEDLDRVLSFPQWAKLANVSERTGREIIERGDGPKVVQLSPNRIGIRVCDHREWLAARTRKAQSMR